MEDKVYMPNDMGPNGLYADSQKHLAIVDDLLEDAIKRCNDGNGENASTSTVAPDPTEKGDEKDEPPHQPPRKADNERTL